MINVLIVEDDPMVRQINEKFLQSVEGFSLSSSAGNLEKAKEAILTNRPDLILLDVFFPQGKGIDLLKWIRVENIKSDVIMITADQSGETIEEALRFGAIDYLVKPFMFERFKEALMQYANRRKSLRKDESIDQNEIDKFIAVDRSFREIELKKDIRSTNKLSPQNEDAEMSHYRYTKNEISYEKGFNQHTYEKILNGIKEMKGKTFTSQQIARKTGVSRITARRYLDYLEKENKLVMEMEYGKVGRPQNTYNIKE